MRVVFRAASCGKGPSSRVGRGFHSEDCSSEDLSWGAGGTSMTVPRYASARSGFLLEDRLRDEKQQQSRRGPRRPSVQNEEHAARDLGELREDRQQGRERQADLGDVGRRILDADELVLAGHQEDRGQHDARADVAVAVEPSDAVTLAGGEAPPGVTPRVRTCGTRRRAD